MTTSIMQLCEQRLRQRVDAGWEVLSEAPLVVAPPAARPGFRSNVMLFAPEVRATELPEPSVQDVVVTDTTWPSIEGTIRHQMLVSNAEGLPIVQELMATTEGDGPMFQLVSSADPRDLDVCGPVMDELRTVLEGESHD